MDKKELARLVERANNGSTEAFGRIYSEFYKMIFYIGLKITGNEHDAGDVVQETMIHVYEYMSKKPLDLSPKLLNGLVSRIATRRSIDILRARKRTVSGDENDSVLEDLPGLKSEFIPHEYAEQEELRQIVLNAVDELNDEQKSVIMLFYYKDMPTKEIAVTLGIDEPLVRTRLFRARQKIKQKLEHLKGGSMFAMAAPVLGRILKMDADSMFDPSLCSDHWMQLADRLGLPFEEAAAVMESVAANATSVMAPAEVVKQVFIAWKAIGAAAAAVVVGVGVSLAPQPPAESVDYTKTEVTQDIFSGEPPLAGMDIPSSEEPEPKAPDRQAPDENSSTVPERETIPGVGATTPTPASGDSEEKPAESEAASVYENPVEYAQSNSSSNREDSQPAILITRRFLSYPLHSYVDEERILSDAGVIAPTGMTLEIEIDNLDTSKPGNYGAYVRAVDRNGRETGQVAIIVTIRETE